MFLVASFMHKRTKQVGQLYSSVCDNSFLSRGFVVSIVPAPRCEVKHAASFAASSRWLSSPRQGSFILSNEAAKYAQVSFWKLTDGLCCWCVIICSSRSFFTVGVLLVLFSFEFLDVPPVGQTTLTSVLLFLPTLTLFSQLPLTSSRVALNSHFSQKWTKLQSKVVKKQLRCSLETPVHFFRIKKQL